jgi:hypothetical protein
MLLLSDQLKHHLENWEADPRDAVANDDIHDIDEDSLVDEMSNHNDNDLANRRVSSDRTSPMNNNILLKPCWCHSWDALILLVGFALGIYSHDYWNWTSVSFWTVAIAVVVGSMIASVFCGNYLRRLQRTRRHAVLQAQHVELATLLSKIGAPPPCLSRMKVGLQLENCNPKETLQDVIDLVKSFAQLLTTIDSSLDRIKSATSMELGLGIWSPAISRVEQHRPRRQCALMTAKIVLAQGLQRGLELFQLQQKCGNGKERVPFTMETVVTISWLQLARRDLVLALTQYIWMPRSEQNTKYCIDAMEEMDAYLRASFFERHEDEPSSLHLVAQHMHAAEIALWAYSRETENEIARHEWMQQFHELLKVACALQETKNMGRRPDSPHDNKQEQARSLTTEIISSPLSFEDTGNMVETNGVSLVPEAAPRTLVFSGKGLVPRKRTQGAAIMTTPSPAASTTAGGGIAQAMLFQELQTFLAANANADEVSLNGEHDHCEEDLDESARSDDASGLRFEVPDRLLAELVLSINKDPPGGETMELFCDHTFSPVEDSSA